MKLVKKTIMPMLLCLTLCSCGNQAEPTPTSFSINLFSNNEKAGYLSGAGNYTKGATATIKANINAGYKFEGWYSDASYNIQVSSNASYAFTVEKAASFYAKFAIETYTITYELDGGTNSPNNPATYTVEDSFSFANPTKTGYSFVNWTKNGTPITEIKKGSTGNITIKANWNTIQYDVTIYTNGDEKGIISGAGKHDYRSKVTITAEANDGYTFVGWYKDASYEIIISEAPSYSFEMPNNNVTFYAYFIVVNYKITYELNGGTNNPKNPNTYTIEDNVTFEDPTFVGYEFANWTKGSEIITGIEKGSTGDITVTANWTEQKYNVNVIINDATRGSVDGIGDYVPGKEVTLNAEGNEGFAFEGWYSDENYTLKIGQLSTYKFNMPQEDINIYAKFVTKAEQDDWDINHGIIPNEIDAGKKYSYGLYPQSHVKDEKVITALNKLEPEEGVFTWYDGEYYVKAIGKPYQGTKDYIFYDGTELIENQKYYFKCEPIIGNVVLESDEIVTIDSCCLLNMTQFDSEDNNIYATSDLKNFLSKSFYETAFQFNSEFIDEREIEDISEKQTVWAGSYNEYREKGDWNIQGNTNRKKKITDYALCNGAGIFEKTTNGIYYGHYWTRSKHSEQKTMVSIIGSDGTGTGSDSQSATPYSVGTGVAPCFLISRSFTFFID